MSFLISSAMAAGSAPAGAQSDPTLSFVMIGVVFVLFYFMLIRPQNKRAKEQRELISNLKKGDEIITAGGILAKVINVDAQYVKVSLAEGVEIYLQRNAVTTLLPKGTIKSL